MKLHVTAIAAGVFVGLAAGAAARAAEPAQVKFNRDVRAILSDSCFQCHGPDKNQRKADLRLDDQEQVFDADRDGGPVVVPGKPETSELFLRVTSDAPEELMPPPGSGKKLTKEQVETLRAWIAQGAAWEKHWALIPPERPALPEVQHADWPRNEIDRFILARLEQAGLTPSAPAKKETLLRRATLDLTGLPPTPEETEAFLNDTSAGTFERVVDRLLDSPRHGERMASRWLDGARYADTNGYQSDGERSMWRWRDWVIEAFNQNLPFDQFTVEQLAGDLLPNPSLDQLIATGFNRNHRLNAEGGVIPEEFAVEYVVDRVETTSTVWLGLTMGCVRCHDHKFDPISQRDFYEFYAYFNNVPERGKAVKFGNSAPLIKAPTKSQQAELAALDARLADAERLWQEAQPAVASAQRAWEQTLQPAPAADWNLKDELLLHYPLDGSAACAVPDVAAGQVQGQAEFANGRVGQGLDLHAAAVVAGDLANFSYFDKFTLAAWIAPRRTSGTIVSRMADVPLGDGYSFTLHNGRLQLNLVKRWLDDAIRVESLVSVPAEGWHHVAATYDGSRFAGGITLYIDGKPVPFKAHLDELNQEFQSKEPLRIGGGGGTEGRFDGLIDDVRLYRRALAPEELAIVATPEPVAALAQLAPADRTPAQSDKVWACFLEQGAPAALQDQFAALRGLRTERAKLWEAVPTTMVMEEMPVPKPTYILTRGEYDKHGEQVGPGTPAALPAFPADLPQNRLGLARWIVSRDNPLTARVQVNRVWQMYFGTGLVKTVDDFGSQGEPPSHPELLDWLALRFIDSGWNLKQLHKTILLSAAYQQSSAVTPDLLARDPDNRLLARGPRVRLSAEMIRDQALFASGLLKERIGGPSVNPYQPDGLWQDLAGVEYKQGHGDDLYRRSLYTYWKRTVAPPTMMTFDAAGRETCIVRETRTNTPLQALTLMNEVTFVEAARALAERVLLAPGTTEERATRAFRLATARLPAPRELKVVVEALERQKKEFAAAPDAAASLLAVGEAPRSPKLDPVEHAAFTVVAGLLLNLDETVTKE